MNRRLLSLMLVLIMVGSMIPGALAQEPSLVSVNGKTVYASDTIDDVRALFGQEKICTISIFGGNAYTFYGENYSDYLFLETNEEGSIVSFNVFGDDYTIGDYGNLWTVDAECYMDGDWGVLGVTGYKGAYVGREEPAARYSSDPEYAIAILEHCVPMWEAISAYAGMNNTVAFDEEAFYLSRQLIEAGSNLDEYCRYTGKSGYCNAISWSSGNFYLENRYAYPCPLEYCYHAYSYIIPENAYIVFDYSYEQNIRFVGSLDKEFFAQRNEVPYTDEEKALLEQAADIYRQSREDCNSVTSYYAVKPHSATLPLEPGQVDTKALEGSVGHLNAIRAGAGLPLLTHDPELSQACQYKAVLTTYLAQNGISNPSPHYPPQVEGISDAFYQKAQMGSGENLFMGDSLSSILYALDDGYGDAITCGHRYNLLNPYYKYIGLGSSDNQGVHKFTGYQDYAGDVVAWPSKGIMLEESLMRSFLMCTVLFLDRYQPGEQTGVKFTCLNTGETVVFEPGMDNTNSKKLYINGDIVSYYSDDINLVRGNVYEITVTGVTDSATGELTDYTYRSVYESAGAASAIQISRLNTDSAMTLETGAKKQLEIEILPADAENKRVIWASDDPDVAEVSGNGFVTGKQAGTAIVTATAENGVSTFCTVTVKDHVHQFGQWIQLREPTQTEEGLEERTCECGETEQRSIEKLEHVPTEPSPAIPFRDIREDMYCYDAVVWAVSKGITTGVTPTSFSPNAACTRGQIVTFLWRAQGSPEPASATNPFADVSAGAYYYKAMLWAVENGITNGTSATTFSPNDPCTRGQVATFLWRTVGKQPGAAVNPFTDVPASGYYYHSVLWAVENGITNGVSATKFAPNDPCSRGQIVTFLYRALS